MIQIIRQRVYDAFSKIEAESWMAVHAKNYPGYELFVEKRNGKWKVFKRQK